MKKQDTVRCKLCGYFRGSSESGPCPACNAPATAFGPSKMEIAAKRKRILSMDLHPIMTHFTVSFTFFLAITFIFTVLGLDFLWIDVGYGATLDLVVIMLPFFVGLTVATGFIDGKARYTHIKSKFLKTKSLLGPVLGTTTVLTLVFHLLSKGGSVPWAVVVEGLLIGSSLVVAMLLGKVGSELTCNVVPSRENARWRGEDKND